MYQIFETGIFIVCAILIVVVLIQRIRSGEGVSRGMMIGLIALVVILVVVAGISIWLDVQQGSSEKNRETETNEEIGSSAETPGITMAGTSANLNEDEFKDYIDHVYDSTHYVYFSEYDIADSAVGSALYVQLSDTDKSSILTGLKEYQFNIDQDVYSEEELFSAHKLMLNFLLTEKAEDTTSALIKIYKFYDSDDDNIYVNYCDDDYYVCIASNELDVEFDLMYSIFPTEHDYLQYLLQDDAE